jgi:rubredoxin
MKMGKLFKCDVCGFIYEGEQPPATCPKCGVGPEHFKPLSEEEANKIFLSDRTNDIHFELITLLDRMILLCNEGIEINLDPNCVKDFKAAKDELWTIKGRSKAELAVHLSKGKW